MQKPETPQDILAGQHLSSLKQQERVLGLEQLNLLQQEQLQTVAQPLLLPSLTLLLGLGLGILSTAWVMRRRHLRNRAIPPNAVADAAAESCSPSFMQTDERALQQAKSALADLRHDLRTPLNAILGYGELLARDAQTPEQQAQAHIIYRNAESLLQMINDMLASTHPESGQVTLKPADFDHPASRSVAQPRLPSPGQPARRILVVDDTATNRMLMVHWLKLAGFELEQAENGQTAVERAIQFRPDLIWMDMRMPGMDGAEAMRQIRRAAEVINHPTNSWQPKILALTAAFDNERQQILAAGFDDFVTKPCSEALFFDKIAQHLDLHYRDAALLPSPLDSQPEQRSAQLNPQPFAMMPADWIARLNYAARSANEPVIFELLEALPADRPDLKDFVTQLLQEFQLSQLIRLTQPNR